MIRKFKKFSDPNLSGKTATHGTTGHTLKIKKIDDGHYKLYRGSKIIGTVFADSEKAAMRSFQKRGYSIS
jgi:hypothetical protein